MMYQSKSGLLVMLTGIVEGSKIKCHQYWPELGSTVTFEYESNMFLDVSTTEDTVGLAWARRVMTLQERRGDVTIGSHQAWAFTRTPDYHLMHGRWSSTSTQTGPTEACLPSPISSLPLCA
jgi:hypothetical protein